MRTFTHVHTQAHEDSSLKDHVTEWAEELRPSRYAGLCVCVHVCVSVCVHVCECVCVHYCSGMSASSSNACVNNKWCTSFPPVCQALSTTLVAFDACGTSKSVLSS
jgi:hypothetical protein